MIGATRRTNRGWRRVGVAAAMIGAAASGAVVAALVVVGPTRLREMPPIASLRSLVPGRGREADRPAEIPPRGWLDIAKRTVRLVLVNRLMAEAAAVTFYALLALFPALTATVSLYGLFADPGAIQDLIGAISGVVPREVLGIVHGQLDALIRNGPKGLSVGVALGLATALWSSNQGSKALFDSLNVIYREQEKRSYVRFVLVAMAFTLGAIVFVIAAMIGVVALPGLEALLHIGKPVQRMLMLLRWPVILLVVACFLSGLYRFGPSREDAKWRWVSWGGALAAVSWVLVSFAFSWYVESFGSFDRT